MIQTLKSTLAYATLAEAVSAAHDSAVVVDRSALGLLMFTGETRLDLIHRMSTQAVDKLQPGQGAATILTSDIGRIIDRLLLLASNDALYAVTGAGNSDNIARYLMRFVFFQDDFHIADLSADRAVLAVYGPQAQQLLSELFAVELTLNKHDWREISWQGGEVMVQRTDPVAGDGYLLFCEQDRQPVLWQFLLDGGIVPADKAAFDYLRIESGLPLFPYELSEEYIPLETGLWEDVSFTKGCYIGQEIIARMESRNRIAKKMVRLKPTQVVAAGSDIAAGSKRAGRLTSIANGPSGPLALGYVRTAILEEEPVETLFVGECQIAVLAD